MHAVAVEETLRRLAAKALVFEAGSLFQILWLSSSGAFGAATGATLCDSRSTKTSMLLAATMHQREWSLRQFARDLSGAHDEELEVRSLCLDDSTVEGGLLGVRGLSLKGGLRAQM